LAEPLKNSYGPEIPRKIAAMIAAVDTTFPTEAFLSDVLTGYEVLELMPRARHIARTLRRHLPADYPKAMEVLMASLGPKPASNPGESAGMAPFLYLPHTFFVAEYGLDDFEVSMQAQYELTQRFTAEFSIRAFLIRHPEKTLARFKTWASDENVHVRRLVSEGTRPRLPWAQRLPAFQKDPRPVLQLLELLKDDSELYVRRSVANNLNDIGKDNPDILLDTAKNWLEDATPERGWIVRHALRSLVKSGNQGALQVLGFENTHTATVRNATIAPAAPVWASAVNIRFEVVNEGETPQRVLLDLRVHYMKANGRQNPKVFKLKTLDLAPGESVRIEKKLSLQELTTRKHYPGIHKVEALINGHAISVGEFELKAAN
jgi:3-methyladenine DNA glycosylase AlkC